MSGIINTSAWGKALWPGINKWYGRSYDEFEVEYTDLFETFSTSRAFEEDVQGTGLGLAKRKAEGAPVEYSGDRQGFITRFTPVEYALGFIITEIMIEDDQYNIVGERKAKGLGFSMRQTKELVAANVYNRAFNNSYAGGDGVSMINAAHPGVLGGTQSNLGTGDLSELALEQACIDIAKWKDEQGLRINVKPVSLHYHVDNMFEAHRILGGTLRYATADNDINVLNHMGKFSDGGKINHYFTDSDAWFIRTNCPDGMKHWERRKDYFKMDEDFDTSNIKYKSAGRYTFGHTDWRGIYGSAGA